MLKFRNNILSSVLFDKTYLYIPFKIKDSFVSGYRCSDKYAEFTYKHSRFTIRQHRDMNYYMVWIYRDGKEFQVPIDVIDSFKITNESCEKAMKTGMYDISNITGSVDKQLVYMCCKWHRINYGAILFWLLYCSIICICIANS